MYNLKKNVHQWYELYRWQSLGSGAWHGRHWAPVEEQHSIPWDCAGAPPLVEPL